MAAASSPEPDTILTELPDERRWQGRDWLKALVAGALALSLLRPGADERPVTRAPALDVTQIAVPAVASTLAPAPAAEAGPVEISAMGAPGARVVEPAEGAALGPGPVTVSGAGPPGMALEILDDDRVIGEAAVGADGRWRAEVALAAGPASLGVRERGGDALLSRPVRVTVGEAPLAAGCGDALAAGCPAWVSRAGGLPLRLRAAPAIAADNIVARLPIGAELTLEEGPLRAGGLSWWRVTTEGGSAGWVAGDHLVPRPD